MKDVYKLLIFVFLFLTFFFLIVMLGVNGQASQDCHKYKDITNNTLILDKTHLFWKCLIVEGGNEININNYQKQEYLEYLKGVEIRKRK